MPNDSWKTKCNTCKNSIISKVEPNIL
jgi:hypothetical protein